ncbi:cyclopropane fatty acyl phospholipid synthase [Legionella pneumophila]|nr:cyclopropane fatty acyl phospholipid synthase [Legionella pneumophila]HAT9855578.1 cyclopropane fatty acyl phospholipid synthase [Legionella pneumophila subsp. pneumophila]HAT8673825.1 cyclopropane fatty acyl phospholipid synthase [Legionella pneumophila]HAU1021371.1 cyclopropane fatty acyl phospholipid synthase [Legionella pneumophila]HAU1058722.1 cyclopropane fatty acyl phospholipid synthase [Legionella pneumophila]
MNVSTSFIKREFDMDIKKNKAKIFVNYMLQLANININGQTPWDIQIYNDEFYSRLLRDADLGLGESYMDGWWDCQRIDLFISKLINANLESKIKINFKLAFNVFLSKILNLQTQKRSLHVGRQHYDRGNDLFQIMLDSNMNYTCGYWRKAENLEQAQLDKLDLTCRKLCLKPGMKLLDIGCGWGGLAKYAAENYGVSVVGITISQQQYELAKTRCAHLPVEIRFQDYRDLNEKFDRIVSLGMFEHVGYKNYRKYMEIVHQCLNDDGLFLLHTIGSNESVTKATPWISKYIFPNGMIPSIMQIGQASEKLFVMEDWHNFGADYYKTLMAWHENFKQGWDQIKSQYSEKFFRMWNYYLLSCAGAFDARMLQLWQIVFSKKGIQGGYSAPR